MQKTRLEAFSDGVIAIIITIMVLELKIPHGINLEALVPLLPNFISYILSYIYIGIYWNNHHHLMHTVKQVSAGIFGRISICCSGFHWYLLLPVGWEKIILNRCRLRFTVLFY